MYRILKTLGEPRMINRVEKLSLLSEMIAFAQKDESVKSIEYKFLLSIAKQLEISQADFDYLVKHPITYENLNSHSERIVQFHRLILLMSLDQNASKKQLVKIHNFGLRMGLSQDSISRVLDLMESFPNKIVPPDFLIDIFKVQYN
ncbi:TerB family tellurite resistance protein [Winogradskyella litorisediminis]|uniref:TerB family tellurite resistance protein n=1 Tax=Winogradskyella litorisediminis TaxID=1156618 RepID=A0ABW3N7G5_9FLAO